MNVGGRNLNKVLKALFQKQHYTALIRSFKVYDRPFKRIRDYVFSTGQYPSIITLRGGFEKTKAELYTSHDLLTVNEIFCRNDYPCDSQKKVIVDIGSNIGISALFFLSRNAENKVYMFEPNPINVKRLRKNLYGYEERSHLKEVAVSNREGELEFGIEETGRYGGLHVDSAEKIRVKCLHINDVLKEILTHNEKIDILKMDTEGAEIDTLNAISAEDLERIDNVYFEEGIEERIDLLNPRLYEKHELTRKGNSYYLIKK